MMKLKHVFRSIFFNYLMRQEASSITSDLASLSALTSEAIKDQYKDSENTNLVGIVFSKDRAIQLYALVRSFVELVDSTCNLYVIYCASDQSHLIAYEEAFALLPDFVIPVRQTNRSEFKHLIANCLTKDNARHCFFLVDDNLFVEKVDLLDFASLATPYSVPTLRMGANLSKCYVMQKEQELPAFQDFLHPLNNQQDYLSFSWRNGTLDWGYPLSVDGHIFLTREILRSIRILDFDSPNTFEEKLQDHLSIFNWRLGVCFEKSRLINIPFNRVQSDISNVYGSIHQDSFLALWQDGYEIDVEFYRGFVNCSAHQELLLNLKKRTAVDVSL